MTLRKGDSGGDSEPDVLVPAQNQVHKIKFDAVTARRNNYDAMQTAHSHGMLPLVKRIRVFHGPHWPHTTPETSFTEVTVLNF